MIIINGKEYGGYVAKIEDETITVILNTDDVPKDVVPKMKDVKKIIEVHDGEETVYNVTAPVSCKFLGQGIYMLVWSTKPSYKQELEALIKRQSDAIDDILVMLLEE